MNTLDFLELLEENKDKDLLFEYMPQQFVRPNYHITEVKHLHVDSVDCGAGTDSWKETVIQLWEDRSETEISKSMSTLKALGILKKVGKIKNYAPNSEVKFEYGNSIFHTAHLYIADFRKEEKNLIINLSVTKTDCKAKETCGIKNVSETDTKQVLETTCSPNSGCC